MRTSPGPGPRPTGVGAQGHGPTSSTSPVTLPLPLPAAPYSTPPAHKGGPGLFTSASTSTSTSTGVSGGAGTSGDPESATPLQAFLQGVQSYHTRSSPVQSAPRASGDRSPGLPLTAQDHKSPWQGQSGAGNSPGVGGGASGGGGAGAGAGAAGPTSSGHATDGDPTARLTTPPRVPRRQGEAGGSVHKEEDSQVRRGIVVTPVTVSRRAVEDSEAKEDGAEEDQDRSDEDDEDDEDEDEGGNDSGGIRGGKGEHHGGEGRDVGRGDAEPGTTSSMQSKRACRWAQRVFLDKGGGGRRAACFLSNSLPFPPPPATSPYMYTLTCSHAHAHAHS